MPSPITQEMRAALAEVVDYAECGVLAWHDIGERVCKSLPQLRALLDALPTVKDSLTAEATTDAADHSEDARAMVTVEARRAMFEAWARGEGLETTRAPEGSSLRGEYLKPRTELAWRAALAQWDGAPHGTAADVIAAAESLARKAESLSDTPEIYPALHALDLAIDAYRAGQSPGDGEMERDAARYRTVRELYWFAQQICARFGVPSEGLTIEAIDAAVDRRSEALRERARAATASAAR